MASEARTRLYEFTAADEGDDVAGWVRRHGPELRRRLHEHGAVVLRGFAADSVERFGVARTALVPVPSAYVEAATPRTALTDDVYTSTDFPASQEIAQHNENSWAQTWPGLLLFGCIVASATGGATPVADVRAVLARLSRPLVDDFARRGWMLVRNYGTGFGLSIEQAFGTADRGAVAAYCARADVATEWSDGDQLRTRQVRSVLARHPDTGDVAWFNHVCFWHVSRLAPEIREMLVDMLGEDGLPFNTYYGDGGAIPEAVVDEIAAAYEAEKVSRPWQPGDLMLVDNMLASHGRESFTGERRVVVAMGSERRREGHALPIGRHEGGRDVDASSERSPGRLRRRPISTRAERLVRTGYLNEGDRYPLVVTPAVAGVALADWIGGHRETVEAELLRHGAILFRGFGVSSVEEFQQVSLAVNPELVEYTEPSTPRGEYMDKVYVSSEYPNYYDIPLHGELSYTYRYPMKALFHCRKAAAKGGETPIADARDVLRAIDPRVREKFVSRGVMYLRNYGDGLLVPWQKVFATDSREAVERYCAENAPMTCDWIDASRLRTRQVRPAVVRHPVTGDDVWFNQAHIFHAYSLGADMQRTLMEQFGEENLPVHALYGDGSPISESELDEVFRAYRECQWAAPWQEGDVLLADNLLMSHGRRAFEGEREVIVCFVEPCPARARA
ncbi:MAG: TauD/TfdA family dioxygenase [Chloroflexi bacterium]|nr:MAG: TauD/TfdA family dioxygenase [Chloroflexota bacterium]